jgi:hypothetical protein
MSTTPNRAAEIAADCLHYPVRPYAIDVVALLADPHYDLQGRGNMLAGAEALQDLIETLDGVSFTKTGPVMTVSFEDVADIALALHRVKGAA